MNDFAVKKRMPIADIILSIAGSAASIAPAAFSSASEGRFLAITSSGF
jgi:hypothetical protein